MPRIGVISDTHGLARPEALDALRGVELILHAGDVGAEAVLARLGDIARTLAVRGNNDHGPWAEALPERVTVEVGAARLVVVHDLATLGLDPRAEGFAAVVAGHSHRPRCERRDGVLYFNPGSAGPRRFRLPISIGFLEIRGTEVEGELVQLG